MSGYPSSLKYFIWPYQVHFKISAQSKSESVFNHFDRSLMPEFFMIGVRTEDDSSKPKICYEPESQDYLDSLFVGLTETAKEILESDPDKNMLYTGPGIQEEMDLKKIHNSQRKAIENILNRQTASDQIYFVGDASFMNGYAVYCILGLNKLVFVSHLHLEVKLYDRFTIYRSVLESSIAEFLKDCKNNLYLPEPGKNLSADHRDYQEILREAARQFMYTVAMKGKDFYGLHGLFSVCNTISTLKYEGKETFGNLIVTSNDHPDLDYLVKLSEPFKVSDIRKTRKLLQLTNDKVGVISNSNNVFGLGYIKGTYQKIKEDIFSVRFRGINCWEVWHSSDNILSMKFGLPHFISEVIDKKKFSSDCKRIFQGISDEQIKNLYELSVAATTQRNGALLVVTDDAEKESRRLFSQCIAIEPLKLEPEMLVNLTAIDGGLLIDRDGIAYAQGVILDGIVVKGGDSARGSRFNSAVTYYHFKGSETPTLIVVVSEDGMVDILPNLKPQIKKSDIENLISYLQSLDNEFDRKLFNDVLYALKAREFYLTEKQCNRINKLKNKINKDNPGLITIVHPDVFPNSEMNGSYFLDE